MARPQSSTQTAARRCGPTRSGLYSFLHAFKSVSNTDVNVIFQDNKLTGSASLFSASGERIEFEYVDGVVHGAAKIKVNIFKF